MNGVWPSRTADIEGTYMKLNLVHATVAAMTVMSLAAPAAAQNDRGRYRSPGSVERSGENRSQPAERAQARTERRETEPRREANPRQAAPANVPPPRVEAPRVAPAPRAQVVTPVQPRPNAIAPRVEDRKSVV